jgi:hypothetical protein
MTGTLAFILPVVTAAFLASLVEAVEALTMVLPSPAAGRPASRGALAGLAVRRRMIDEFRTTAWVISAGALRPFSARSVMR